MVATYVVNPIPLSHICINAIVTKYLKVLNIQKNKIAETGDFQASHN